MMMSHLKNIVRSPGDPRVERSGPSSRRGVYQLGRALGWFSIGLGLAELLATRPLTQALGMEGQEGLVRAYGAREIGAGVLTLSTEKDIGLWSRVAGDGLDLVTLASALRADNPKRTALGVAIAMVAGVTLLDLVAADALTRRRRPARRGRRDYSDRSGFPQGLDKARGAAKEMRRSLERRPTAELAAV